LKILRKDPFDNQITDPLPYPKIKEKLEFEIWMFEFSSVIMSVFVKEVKLFA